MNEMRKLMEAIDYIDEMEFDEAAGGVKVPVIIIDEDDGEVYGSDEYRSITSAQAGDLIKICIEAVFGGGRYEGVDSDSILEALQELRLTAAPEYEEDYE